MVVLAPVLRLAVTLLALRAATVIALLFALEIAGLALETALEALLAGWRAVAASGFAGRLLPILAGSRLTRPTLMTLALLAAPMTIVALVARPLVGALRTPKQDGLWRFGGVGGFPTGRCFRFGWR